MKRLLTPLLLLIIMNVSAQQADFLWAKDIASGYATGKSMVLDSDGNIYTVGGFGTGNDFDPGPGTFPLAGSGPSTGFISKLDPSGNLIWAKELVGTYEQPVWSVCVDFYQNVYLTGWFGGSADFDPGPASYILTASPGYTCCYILKLDAAGNFVWAQSLGGMSTGHAITCDLSGMNIYITGAFSETITFNSLMFGTTSLTAVAGGSDCFIAQLDAQGNSMWAQQIGGINNEFGSAICLDNSGSVIVSGNYVGTIDFDPGPGVTTMNSGINLNAFVLKLYPWGDFVWAKNIGDASNSCEHITSVFAGNGDVLITGSFEGTSDFDPGAAVYNMSCPYHDGFVLKLDNNGDFVWARQFGDSTNGQDVVRAVTSDGSGNCYLTGDFQESIDFDPGAGSYTLSSLSDYDVFISKLDANGDFIWAKQLGGNDVQQASSIQLDAYNNIFSMGYFRSLVDFNTDAGVYTMTAAQDVYIHKMGLCTPPSPPQDVTGNLNICRGDSIELAVSGSGLISWYTSASDTVAFQYGNSYESAYDTTTTFYVQDSTCNNSPSRTAITVVVNVPQVSVSGSDTICYGETITLTASGAQDYVWSSGGTTGTEQVMPLSSATYTVIGTDGYSCSDTADFAVFVHPAIDVSVTLNGAAIMANNANASYQWIDCNDPWIIITSDTNQTYEPWTNGNYAVIVSSGTCYDTSVCVTVASVGLHAEKSIHGVSVFPNPGQGQFVVQAAEPVEISIINALGAIIVRRKMQAGKNELDLSEFSDGIYMLKQENEIQQTRMIRIIKAN